MYFLFLESYGCFLALFLLCQVSINLFVILLLVLLPFGEHILKYLPDPFNMDAIGTVAANIIAERTKANGHSKAHVSFTMISV